MTPGGRLAEALVKATRETDILCEDKTMRLVRAGLHRRV
jgi:hypothetical protein